MFKKWQKVLIEWWFNDWFKWEIVSGDQNITFLWIYYEVKVGNDKFMHSEDKLTLV